jgi:hypothetical protein
MANDLVVGSPRLGWFFDNDPDTPQTATLLQDSGTQITLTVPWLEQGPPGQYARWFHGTAVQFGDDPDRTRFSYLVPELLHFEDIYGPVALVGCRNSGMHGHFFSSTAQGIIWIQFAVLGARGFDYTKINGLRSQVPGLSDWIALPSLSKDVKTTEGGRIESLHLDLKSPEPLSLAPTMNLQLRPNFRVEERRYEDATVISELLQIETRVADPRPWLDHIVVHNTVRDLVDIAGWRTFGYSKQWALRDDDPVKAASGDRIHEKWSTVRSYAVRADRPTKARPDFLFSFDDIGTTGYRKWATLRRKFKRGLDPILFHFDRPDAPVQTALVEANIGFEALGFQLALDAGLSKEKADAETHRARLRRITEQLTVSTPFNTDEWINRAVAAYMGVKHAKRDMPDVEEMYWTLLESWVVFRYWIAAQIGVPTPVLERNARTDPLVMRLPV